MHYAVTLGRDEDGGVVVRFPDVPEAQAAGEYEADALVRARDVLAGAFTAYIKERRPIPRPSDRPGHRLVKLPILIEAKLCLYEAMREARIGRGELARRLHWHRPQVDRLLNLRHASKLEKLEVAAAVLGSVIAGGTMMAFTTAVRLSQRSLVGGVQGGDLAQETIERMRNHIACDDGWFNATCTATAATLPAANSADPLPAGIVKDKYNGTRNYTVTPETCGGAVGDCLKVEVKVHWDNTP